ncbi:MAG: FxDxF family PEP-CTERM protein [Burkholderiales bacterium]
MRFFVARIFGEKAMTSLSRHFLKSASALLLAAGLLLPVHGQAQVERFNEVAGGTIIAPDERDFAGSFINATAGTTFLDHWAFSVTPDSLFTSITLTLNDQNGIFAIVPASFSTALFTSAGVLVEAAIQFNTVLGQGSLVPFSPIAAGDYDLRVAGELAGITGGAYAGHITLAIPEPETYAMLLAGLALMGFVARRRKSALNAAA